MAYDDIGGIAGSAPAPMAPSAVGLTQECTKSVADDASYIDTRSPESQVVLSKRLEYLVRRIGGCQTEEVLTLVKRLVYEAIRAQRKY